MTAKRNGLMLAQLGPSGQKTADCRRSELSQGRLTLSEVIVQKRQLVATVDDTP
jgi:hypothetical protein